MKRNMKKTYINPEIEVVELQMKQAMMLTMSGETKDENDLLNLDPSNSLWEQ